MRERSGSKFSRVLVTGAAGSVGSALALKFTSQFSALGLLDHADHGLLDIVERVVSANPDINATDYLCDIRDQERMTSALVRFAPDTVVHCAALKHVHLGERHPGECVLTNLVGMRNALVAAQAAGAKRFMLISTDKAAAPVCVMGATKRLAELYLSGFQRETGSRMQLKFVRFGNVMGSQGSVLPRFEAQIAEGGPLKITHADMTRFFMSADEAVRFIEEALWAESGVAPTGYFKDMGEAVSILELGRRLIAQSGRDIPIEFTGLRPGERLSEQLFDEFDAVTETSSPGMFRVAPKGEPAISSEDIALLESHARRMDDAVVRQRVFALLDTCLTRNLPLVG